MKLKAIAMMAIIPAAIALSGCVVKVGGGDHGYQSNWEEREEDNRRLISRLELDQSIDQITSILGSPDFTESHKVDNSHYRVLFYRTQRRKGDGITTKDECTPLVFDGERLIGWGDAAYRKI